MAEWNSRFGKLALVLAATFIAGCPQIQAPQLSATPAAVDFGSGQTTRNLSLSNTGGGTLTWTAQEVTRINVDSPWVPGEVPWLSLSVAEGTIGTELENLTLTATREGLSTGIYNNTGVQISSNGGTATVPVSLTIESALSVTPLEISLSATDATANFTVINNGAVPLNWTTAYLLDADDPSSTIPLPNGFTLTPANGTNQAGGSASVAVTFPAGTGDFAIRVTSPSGAETVKFTVGASLEGLIVNPTPLRVYKTNNTTGTDTAQPASTLTLENVSTLPISWTLSLADRLDRNTPPSLSATPVIGTTAVGATSEVQVRITDPAKIVESEDRYELIVRSGASFQVVPIVIDILPLPDIALALPPQTEFLQPPVVETSLLDFGTDLIQAQFWIANVGGRDSELYFDIVHEDQDATSPLIVSITPLRGNTNGTDQDYFLPEEQVYTDGVPVTVTIDRSKLVEDVETRTITVRAFNSSFTNRLTNVDSATIEIRIEKQPLTITGALNRSRPPNLMRFVFSNRDDLGQIIPLQTAADRTRLSYDIFEDEIPLDLTETSQFLTYDYRGNVVLMLDYTGSMYNAGTTGDNALEPGEAVEYMRNAAEAFIDDLPSNFKLQLMYFSDRSPQQRIIQPFTSDRALLRTALRRFTLTPAQFGESDINEALVQAMDSLVAEDPQDTLPLDDADVRAIVYISDGEDTTSGVAVSEVERKAEDTHTRLFPVAYSPNGDPVNASDLITLSTGSGGYLYSAGDVRDLEEALGTRSNMRLAPVTNTVDGVASFVIENLSSSEISYSFSEDLDTPWVVITGETTGTIEPNSAQGVPVNLSTGEAEVGTVLQGSVNVSAGNGTGTVDFQFTVGPNGTTRNAITTVRDEPGTLWEEFNNQSVLTYITPKEESFEYLLSGRFLLPDERVIEGPFERDGNFIVGDPRVGQVSLKTAGIIEDLTTIDPNNRFRAEVYVYADFVPRNITAFSFRFHTLLPEDVSPSFQSLLQNAQVDVEVAKGGLLADDGEGTSDWRLISGDGDGRYRVVTDEENYLPFGSFGNLLKITISNLDEYVAAFGNGARQPALLLSMRMDNEIYISPQSEHQPSGTKYFLYPGGPANIERRLNIELNQPDLAPPSMTVGLLAGLPDFDPETVGAFDFDQDSFPDFNDSDSSNPEFPGSFIVPNPFEVVGTESAFTLTIRNDTLDKFTWNILSAQASELLESFDTADTTADGALNFAEVVAFLGAFPESDFRYLDNNSNGTLTESELHSEELPAWLPRSGITYGAGGGAAPRSTLLPGETETVHFTVDRSGETPGTTSTVPVSFSIRNSEYTFFVPEIVPITLVTNP